MSTTYMPKAGEITRDWYILDAAGVALGRTAATAAMLLRGKHKTTFVTHLDCGDHVVIINAEKAVLTGKKLVQKKYRHHTGWVGGLNETSYAVIMKEHPEKAMMLAIEGMLPDTTIGRSALTRVRIYRGPQHKQQAQMPKPFTAGRK